MVTQINLDSLVRAIADSEILEVADRFSEEFRDRVADLLRKFLGSGPSPGATLDLENALFEILRILGRDMIERVFSLLEPELDEMPETVQHQGETYRRLAGKTERAAVLTRFGNVSLVRGRYRLGRAGKAIFPLERILGIQDGVTPSAADRVGKQFAATGSSQGRTLEMIRDQMGERIGAEKLRKIVKTLAEEMEPFREQTQVERLTELISEARKTGEKPVLSVSRDGVALGLAPWSSFEMASVGTISVLAGGERLGTVYLGCAPETNQATMSANLTSLLTETIRASGQQVPEIVYVTDAGKIETAYWKNTLRSFFVDGRRIKITRVVDYYHASERLTKIANALLFSTTSKRTDWLKKVRKLLLKPGGHGRVLRSISAMRANLGYKISATEEAETAERYLRRYRRFMDYAGLKEQGYPLGSGIVESACKQVVSERLKLSGMRWHHTGGQRTMTLRCLLLSGIWDKVYRQYTASKPTVADLMHLKTL